MAVLRLHSGPELFLLAYVVCTDGQSIHPFICMPDQNYNCYKQAKANGTLNLILNRCVFVSKPDDVMRINFPFQFLLMRSSPRGHDAPVHQIW